MPLPSPAVQAPSPPSAAPPFSLWELRASSIGFEQ